jgi:hypothetical protein
MVTADLAADLRERIAANSTAFLPGNYYFDETTGAARVPKLL